MTKQQNRLVPPEKVSEDLYHDIEEIAIIGMAGRFPGAKNIEAFWQNLHNGVEALSHFAEEDLSAAGIPPDVWQQPNYVRAGFVLEDIDCFDAGFFGLSRRQAELTDPQQRFFLECAWEALERAAIDPSRYPGLIGLYAGANLSGYLMDYLSTNQHLNGSASYLQALVSNDKDYLVTQTAYKLNLTGPSVNVQTACSTGLVAVHLACQSLLNNECDVALAGAVTIRVPHKAGYLYQEGTLFAPDGHCRPFDAQAQGTVAGNGIGIVVLKRLSEAIADRDHILAVIKGSAVNNDGSVKIGYTAPSEVGQRQVIVEALGAAGVEPQTISYIEAHGTGTPLGDPIEMTALNSIFANGQLRSCAIGAVKGNIGHLENAAGVVGLIKTVLALQHQQLPPTLHFTDPNPQIDFAHSPFYVNATLTPWISHGTPRRAGVSSFGIGGTNAHVVLEEAPVLEAAQSAEERPWQLLCLSAKNEDALIALATRYVDYLGETKDAWADIVYTAMTGRAHFEHRLAIVAASKKQAQERLQAWLQAESLLVDLPWGTVCGTVQAQPRLAFLFTGQGAQYLQMGRALYESEPTFREVIDHCDGVLQACLGRSLLELLYPATQPEHNDLMESHPCAQAANFALECALADLWRSWGVEPNVLLGHSLGDFAAAYTADVLSLSDGLRLVTERGRLMETACGKMLAVRASEGEIAPFLVGYNDAVIGVINGPESIVLSGGGDTIAQVATTLNAAGFKTHLLAIPVAAHSPLLDPVLDEFAAVVGGMTLTTPQLPIVSSMTGKLVAHEVTAPGYWRQHLRNSVRFADGLTTLHEQNVALFLEIGPKPTLLGMAEQMAGHFAKSPVAMLPSLRENQNDWQQMLESLGQLYVRGVEIDWTRFFERNNQRRKVLLPTYPFQRQRYWRDAQPDYAIGRGGRDKQSSFVLDLLQQGNAQQLVAQLAGANGLSDVEKQFLPKFVDLLLQQHRHTLINPPLVDWLYEVVWHPQTEPATYMPTPEAIAAEVKATPLFTTFATDGKIESYRAAMTQLDARSLSFIARALRQLGWKGAGAVDIAQLGVLPIYEALLARWLDLLADAPVLDSDNEPEEPSMPLVAPEATLLQRCGERLAEVLQGACDPVGLLFPAGDLQTPAQLYANSPEAEGLNRLVAQAMEQVLAALPADSKLRILEIGAGTGGTTAHLLPQLRAYQVDYLFSDISPFFLEKAQGRFADYDFVHYQLLDIERAPQEQRFTEQYDIVIAANVLHATSDLHQTLAHVRQLLKPGGLLILLEGVEGRPWLDVTFGLTEGWWRFTDTALRPDYPLLRPEQWQQLLAACEFVQPVAVQPAQATQAIILAQNAVTPVAHDDEPGQWLILADQSGLAQQLQSYLHARGQRSILVFKGKGYAQIAAQTFCVADAPADWQQLFGNIGLADRATRGISWRGIIHLWGLDLPAVDAITTAEVEAITQESCSRTIHLLQTLVAECASPPKLWLVTRHALAVSPRDSVQGVAQSPLWGLGKVIALEHPEAWGGLIDLGPEADEHEATRLLAEIERRIALADGDDQVAFRDGQRWVPRLQRRRPEPVPSIHFAADATYLITGGLGYLGLEFVGRLIERGARHLVLTGRSPVKRQQVIEKFGRDDVQIYPMQADVADAASMSDLFESIQNRMPPLRGVIHAAGVTEYRELQEMQAEEVARTLRAKISGTWLLHELTKEQSLDFFVMFSSAGAVWGARGQGHYAAANHFLDAFATYRRGLALPAASINWGTVAGTRMATDEYFQWLAKIGMADLGPERAFASFLTLLGNEHPQLVAADMDWEKFKAVYEARGPRPLLQAIKADAPAKDAVKPNGMQRTARPSAQPAGIVQQLADAPPDERLSLLIAYLQREIAKILGEAPPSDLQTGFFDMGMDSLMTVELIGRLKAGLGCDLPSTLAFDYANVESLAHYLAQEVLQLEIRDETETAQPQVADEANFEAIQTLPETELQALIQQELAELKQLL